MQLQKSNDNETILFLNCRTEPITKDVNFNKQPYSLEEVLKRNAPLGLMTDFQ